LLSHTRVNPGMEFMSDFRPKVQALDRSGVLFAALIFGFGAIYEATWALAPSLMRLPLWKGSSIPLSVPFGIAAIFLPLVFAWLSVRHDQPILGNQTNEVSNH
jgi:hypothetical protein